MYILIIRGSGCGSGYPGLGAEKMSAGSWRLTRNGDERSRGEDRLRLEQRFRSNFAMLVRAYSLYP
jgi:hypothetical protein